VSDTRSILAWRAVAGLATVAAAFVTHKVLSAAWRFVTGNQPPDSPENPDTGTAEAVTWAVASGVAVAVARLFATRKTAQLWRRATGAMPPGMERVRDDQA